MKGIGKTIKFLLIAALFSTAIQRCDIVREWRNTATVYLDGTTLTASQAEEICQDETRQDDPFLVCFFGEQTATVSCEENGNSASVTQILAGGNTELLVNGGSELYWAEDGCLIDSDTAWSLFGSTQASGQILWIDGSACTVCGTFESEQPMVIRNASFTDESVLTTVLLKADTSDNLTGKADQFLGRHGLAGAVISTEYLNALMSDLLLLVPLLLFYRLVRFMLNHEKNRTETVHMQPETICENILKQKTEQTECEKKEEYERKETIAEKIRWSCYLGIACLLFFALIRLAFHYFEIPSDMIPTRWSDFSFWSEWWLARKETILLIWATPLSQIQINLLWNCLVSIICTIVASFLALDFT